jgi:DNA-binding protein HU-beta
VTKAEIVNKIAQKTGLDKGDVLATMEAFFKIVKTSMAEGENIYIRGFGSFILKKRARKMARIISEKKPIIIEPHYIPSFKPSKMFVDKVKTSESIKHLLKKEEA